LSQYINKDRWFCQRKHDEMKAAKAVESKKMEEAREKDSKDKAARKELFEKAGMIDLS